MNIETINDYITGLYEDKAGMTRRKYESETKLRRFTPVVQDETARIISLLLHLTQAQRVLELGMSIGFSTTTMAKVVKEYSGKIITIEIDERVAVHARRNFKHAGVEDFIEVHMGDANEIVPGLQGEFDVIFQDTDKFLYPKLFKDCVRLLKQGGLLIADNTLFPVLDIDPKIKHLIPPIEEFNQMVANCQNLVSTILPLGYGVTVAVKK